MTDPQAALALEALRQLQQEIRWKAGKALSHLEKRIRLKHLPEGTTLEVYGALILSIVQDPSAELLVYQFGEHLYPTVVAMVEERLWLVMMDANGVMETAFPPDDPEIYGFSP
jgi:hypothetical protein